MDTNSEELLRKYLDGDLSPEEEREVLHYIAEDAEMRSMLRFEQQLNRASSGLQNLSSAEVPTGFSDRLISQIETEEAETAESWGIPIFGSRIRALWESVLEPRQIQLRPLYAMAMAVVLVAILLVGTPYFGVQQGDQLQQEQLISQSTTSEGASVESVSDDGEEVWTRFVYIDKNAESVSVAGDFSNWEPIALTKKQLNGEQVWTGLVPMERGEHRYMFVRNGEQWVTDPLATVQQDDGFGNKNAVIYL